MALSPTSSGKGASAAGTGLAQLFDQTLGAPAVSIDTGAGGVAQTQTHLLVVATLRADNASALPTITLTVNNDATAVYDTQVLSGGNVTASAGVALAATGFASLQTHGAGGAASFAGSLVIFVPHYRDAAFFKTLLCLNGANDPTAANNVLRAYSLSRRVAEAVSRLAISAQAGGNLIAGSRLTVLGF